MAIQGGTPQFSREQTLHDGDHGHAAGYAIWTHPAGMLAPSRDKPCSSGQLNPGGQEWAQFAPGGAAG